ncbi:hypothetical protein [Nocardiopsis sp. MG754419]|uniref:hypothetical protein n=1 Tax=Nocardiopsis sp. MG754419 TaxID=2259865 RepID=UPI001BA91566|nr:hypothetical protein [Nocardiopsis sp. MG754419]MBR8743843.1 hypothetical protein [Nocardiopsis sp. MG754419]
MKAITTLAHVSSALGRGLLAGAVGTAAMTVSSTLEARLRRRGASSAPAHAAGEVLRVRPVDDPAGGRFATAVHWGYGTGWGGARGLVGALGLSGPAATLVHLGLVWGSAQVMLPATDTAPPLWHWSPTEIGLDLLHHGVYAAVTGSVYELLDGA